MKKLTTLLLLTTLASLTGCAGYHTGVSKPAKLANIKTLAVPTFINRTLVPRIEVMTTNAVIKQLQTTGSYQIVNRDEADGILIGEIADIQNTPFRSVATNTLQTAEIMSHLRVVYYIQNKDGAKIFVGQKIGLSHEVLDRNFQLTQAQILDECAEKLAKEVASELTEGW